MTFVLAEPGLRRLLQEPLPGIPQEPPPLPGGVAAVVRWFFNVPQWIQISGAILAAIVGIAALWFLWRRRVEIRRWLRTRARAVQVALAAAAALLIVVFGTAASVSWDYMMHDNDFCTACHVMGPAFQRFTDSEHATLNCHDCHRQSIVASSRQLYLWVVDRPEEIGEHAPVPTATCTECHATGRDSTWQRVLATAGHRTHLESDSSALAHIACVTCHGQEVHRFVPADQTCGQADCHAPEDTRIVLGAMTGVTGFHCISCHEFTRPLPPGAPPDTVRAALVPGHAQCVSCHEMSDLLASFDVRTDPHGGACGDCHDPHRQETPQAAAASCTESGCHAGAEELSPFHRGVGSGTLEDCVSCHAAHDWRVEGTACLDCHADVLEPGGGGARRAAAPEDRVHAASASGPGIGLDLSWLEGAAQSAPPFDHASHASLSCDACHSSERTHGEVTVRTEEQCASCHHASPATEACSACHAASELAADEPGRRTFETVVAGSPVTRELGFSHGQHAGLACEDCHARAGRRGVFASPASCASCHERHHEPGARCSACHTTPLTASAHGLEVHADATCEGAGCHARESGEAPVDGYASRSALREPCLACHVEQVGHEPEGACASCHLIPGRAGGPAP